MSYCHCYWSWKVCPLPQEVYCSVLRNCQTVTPVVMKVRMTGVNAVQCTACLAVVAHGGWSTGHTLACTRVQHLFWTDSLLSLA